MRDHILSEQKTKPKTHKPGKMTGSERGWRWKGDKSIWGDDNSKLYISMKL